MPATMSAPAYTLSAEPAPGFWWKLTLHHNPYYAYKRALVAHVSANADWDTLSSAVSGLVKVSECTAPCPQAFHYAGMQILDGGSWAAMNAELRAYVLATPGDAVTQPVYLGTLEAVVVGEELFTMTEYNHDKELRQRQAAEWQAARVQKSEKQG
ncbi:hypothetical protein FA95DRAFT_1618696 [Auriscalpium vulgare]|uniref:Uncharacterized protein n=1 Tax=Auriscalpium vulgare TaxID=40419 RepID=A0ACB8S7S4_9AGAM|nr:hypothetical protein FA95DRAFT_1618696 [Auriscalpium vulgare]